MLEQLQKVFLMMHFRSFYLKILIQEKVSLKKALWHLVPGWQRERNVNGLEEKVLEKYQIYVVNCQTGNLETLNKVNCILWRVILQVGQLNLAGIGLSRQFYRYEGKF